MKSPTRDQEYEKPLVEISQNVVNGNVFDQFKNDLEWISFCRVYVLNSEAFKCFSSD